MRRAFRWFALLVAIAAIAIAAAGWVVWQRYDRPGPLDDARNIVVPRGAGVDEIAEQLARAGVLDGAIVFRIMTRVDGTGHKLKAGEYAFAAGISPRGVAELLASGKTVIRRVTIPEGLMTVQALALFRQAEGLVGDVAVSPPEGTIMPSTYFYSWGDDRARLIERATHDMSAMVAELWAKRAPDLPIASPQQAVVLASIVERETGKPDERPHVAAVFINRLKRGIKLQADPTVAYGVTGGRSVLDRPLSRADLDRRTEWNTYVIEGLPPTPIANPGRASVAAVLNPATSKDLYFVADGTGGHVFAETLADHNRNVARLRQIERDRAVPRP